MKKFIYLLSAAITITSCTDLEVEEFDSIVNETSETGGFTGVTDAQASLDSGYNDIQIWAYHDNLYAMAEVSADHVLVPTRGTDWGDNGVFRTLHQHTWDPTHAHVVANWDRLNERVYKMDQLLATSGISAEITAQAKFIRAMHMTTIVDWYGQVPRRDVNSGPSDNPTVLDSSAAVDLILSDLDTAIAGLTDLTPGLATSDAIKDGTNRISKTAAQFLKARVLLNKHVWTGGSAAAADMTEVISLVDAITAQGFALDANYFGIFDKTGDTETIFSTPFQATQKTWNGLHYYQTTADNGGGGWNGYSTIADLYNSFEGSSSSNAYDPTDTARDIRRGFVPRTGDGNPLETDADAIANKARGFGYGFLIGQQYNDAGVALKTRGGAPLNFTADLPGLTGNTEATGIREIKYHPKNGAYYNGVVLYRYADAFLMKIEAIHRGGTSSDDKVALFNQLRTIRNASTITAAQFTEDMLLAERGRELYTEYVRRTDLIRFGKFGDNWTYKGGTSTGKEKFPIPAKALSSNPNLQQNPGY